MLIIPAIDLFEGKCVRLRQGDYDERTVYSDAPKATAKAFLDAGFSYLHIVDLEGAKAGTIRNSEAIRAILALDGVQAQVGGGVRTEEDVQRLLEMGVSRVIVGSVAVKSPTLVGDWLKSYGADRIAIALDIKKNRIAYGGWLNTDPLLPTTFIQSMMRLGANTFICTDVERDGMLNGPNIDLYKQLMREFPSIELIASGGVSNMDDLERLEAANISSVIVGKALYEGKMNLRDLKKTEN